MLLITSAESALLERVFVQGNAPLTEAEINGPLRDFCVKLRRHNEAVCESAAVAAHNAARSQPRGI